MELLATNYHFTDTQSVYRGEVRDVYVIGDQLISVSTDRLSVFGHTFTETIPYKGQVLNQLAYFCAEQVKDIVPHWIESLPDPNASIGKLCKPFEINMVIRGALIGHAWRVYQTGLREICGIRLPDGLKEYAVLTEPIITPTTKSQNGFETDIEPADIVTQGIMSESEYERLAIITRQLFIRGKQLARNKGLVLADTKYEFGIHDDAFHVIDEIHTPDSSRYFIAKEFDAFVSGKSQKRPKHLSKEYIREWLLENNFSGLGDQTAPAIPEEIVDELSARYIELYQKLTGKVFMPRAKAHDIEKLIKSTIDRNTNF